MKFIYLLLIAFVAGCSTYPHPKGHEQYVDKIEAHSAGDKQFAGVYEQFEFRSTLLTREISQLIHDRLALVYEWNQAEAAAKLAERMSKLNDTTVLWLSFFTPDRKDDNLATQHSIWKIYLDAGGKRYEGRAVKANMNLSEAQAIIPYHTRWATPYYIEFPVPTDELVGVSKSLVITGPLGRREVFF